MRATGVEQNLAVGPWSLRLRLGDAGMARALWPAFAHLPSEARAAPDLTICAWDSASTRTAMPRPPWGRDAYGPRGEILGFNGDRYRTVYMHGIGGIAIFDRERQLALYWVEDAAAIPYWERSFPFRVIFHWAFRGHPLQPLHAGAVGLPEGGVLITGKSGSGKTTTTLACIDSPLRYAGDDYVLVAIEPSPYVHSLYNSAKLEAHSLRLLPNLAPYVTNPDRQGDDKALIFLHASRPEKLIAGFPIRAVLVPRVSGQRDTRLRPLTGAAAALALAPSTIMHLQGDGPQAFRKIMALSQRVPAYELILGTEMTQIPEVIAAAIAGTAT